MSYTWKKNHREIKSGPFQKKKMKMLIDTSLTLFQINNVYVQIFSCVEYKPTDYTWQPCLDWKANSATGVVDIRGTLAREL